MPKSQKLKIIVLLKILMERSDEEHILSMTDIINALAELDIISERKSIYDDIECLRLMGYDIICQKGKNIGYYIGGRDFELAELKLLVDAVASSKFITERKSNSLIKKIEGLASNSQAKQLQRQVFVSNRVKTMNERIYYNIDAIHSAIADKKQISFKYFEYSVAKQKIYRKNGEKYITNPVALSWDDENYYLITYSEKYIKLVHYRVDKMDSIEILNTAIAPMKNKENFNIADYSKKVFSMFGGEEQEIKLRFDNSLVGVVLDRFGKDIHIKIIDEKCFEIYVKVAVSPSFFGWLFQFYDKVKIIEPQSVAEQFKEKVDTIKRLY